jgi:hypothetical protein
MALDNPNDILAQEQKFRKHVLEFIKPRTENSQYPDECIKLLKGDFSRKLGITNPEINFFCYDNLTEYLTKKQEVEKHPNYQSTNEKTKSWQPRAALNAYEAFLKKYPQKEIPVLSDQNPIQKIFFGAPGTGKSYKVNSILPNEDIWSVSGETRKQLFLDSDTAKKAHYADVLDNKEKFGDIWNVDELSALEEKLPEVDSEDNVSNPEHSALQAYIKFLKEYKFKRVFRTTFHPDYDYAQFVGAYKPKKEGNTITYSFVPQVFAKAYAAAWKLYLQRDSRDSIGASPLQNDSGKDIQVYLVIEEINRGNCAQIFGDIFQLLDRDEKGFSQYSIDADCDFAEWLKTNDNGLKSVWPAYEEKVGDGKLNLPPNLNILATMNTSDQSLFPMDSAFKRRFDWEYVPISFDGKDAANFQIDIDGTQYSWQKFVETVNEKILTLTESEDKQLGEFFIKPDNGKVISRDRFLGKVMFYLWNEVCKDEHKNGSFFRVKDKDGKEDYFTFQDLYRNKDLLKQFMEELLNGKP